MVVAAGVAFTEPCTILAHFRGTTNCGDKCVVFLHCRDKEIDSEMLKHSPDVTLEVQDDFLEVGQF